MVNQILFLLTINNISMGENQIHIFCWISSKNDIWSETGPGDYIIQDYYSCHQGVSIYPQDRKTL